MAEQVWAEEPGIQVKFERVGSQVKVTIVEVCNHGQDVVASATIGSWRWDRVVAAVAVAVHAGEKNE